MLIGAGRGKTTSALGLVLRAVGHGMHPCVIHFIKARDDVGEALALRRLPEVEEYFCGLGFIRQPDAELLRRHAKAAVEGLNRARQRLQSPDVDMVVLDEICDAVSLGLFAEKDLLDTLALARPEQVVVLTGHDAGPALLKRADTVSRVVSVKHGYESGWPPQRGVEL